MHARTPADKRRHQDDQEHWKRWAMVEHLRLRLAQDGGRLRKVKGLSVEAAVEQTAEALGVSVETVKYSRKEVQRRVREGGVGRYLIWIKAD